MNIPMKKRRAMLKILALCLLCAACCTSYLLLSYLPHTSAQEAEIRIRRVDTGASEAPVVEVRKSSVIIVDGEKAGSDGSDWEIIDAKESVAEEAPGETPVKIQAAAEDGNVKEKSATKYVRPEPGNKIKPEVGKGMPEKRQDMAGENRVWPQATGEAPAVPPKGKPEGKKDDSGGGSSGGGGLQNYLSAIVQKNLFLQLGSGREEKKASYDLTAVISSSDDSEDKKAIIDEAGGAKSYYVSEGESFAGVKVIDVEEQSVKLDRSGEEINLTLGAGGGGGPRGGGGGGRPRGDGPDRSGGGPPEKGAPPAASSMGGNPDDFDPDKIPPFALRMLESRGISLEDLRNNPDLRTKVRQEFERSGGGNTQRGARRRDRAR